MANQEGSLSEQATSQSLAYNLPTIVAAYLASLAIIAYPLGFYTLWTQIWREYTHDSFTALYATALLPAPAVAGRALSILYLLIYTGAAASIITEALTIRVFLLRGRDDLAQAFLEEDFLTSWRHASRMGKVQTIGVGLTALGQAVLIPLAASIVVLDSLLDLFLYALYVLFVVGSGLWAGSILSQSHWERFTAGVVAIYIGALLAAMALIPLQQTPLPVVRFSDGVVREATLISQAGDYWYVIQEGEHSLSVLPNDAVGTISISERSR